MHTMAKCVLQYPVGRIARQGLVGVSSHSPEPLKGLKTCSSELHAVCSFSTNSHVQVMWYNWGEPN